MFSGVLIRVVVVLSIDKMDPTSLSLLIGENATIKCTLSDANSSRIWFYEERSRRRIQQPSDDIQILDPFTAILTIRNAEEQKGRYQCKIQAQAIGVSEVYVGTKPTNVTDFKCKVYDYEYMECSFTRPKNMLLTQYELQYGTSDDKEKKTQSEDRCQVEERYRVCLLQDGDDNKFYCNITDRYFPVRNLYVFKLTARNDKGKNEQCFRIHNDEIVVPAAIEFNINNITSDSVMLKWKKHNVGYYPRNLKYRINLRDNRTNEDKDEYVNWNRSAIIKNLKAYWPYAIKIQAKSMAVDDDDDTMWSEATEKYFNTSQRKPDRAPKLPLGSFYIYNTETQLRLYWEQLEESEQNGPEFHYIINEINEDDIIINTTRTNDTTIAFPYNNNHIRTFNIKSANILGESEESNSILVYPSGNSNYLERQYVLNENSIAKIYHNKSYTLSWSPPQNIKDLLNYTVFWCLPKIELPNQCKGPIHFKYINKNEINFTTEPKDRSLNLAISANYPYFNKGMQWAQCSGDVSSELMKMEIEVSAVNDSAILVKWNSGSVCASILKGYNLRYWLPNEQGAKDNNNATIDLLREKQEHRNYTITNLRPYTEVCLSMFMYSPTKQGHNSDTKCIKTKQAAPSAPRNLNLVTGSITSKSALIKWEPPAIRNGELTMRKSAYDAFDKTITSINQTFYTLTSLNSYSNYEVYVTAHTVDESKPSNRINISTLIGIPSNPCNVNITENDGLITWDPPMLPSGRLELYVVALIRSSNDSSEIIESISLTKERSCRFRIPECYSAYYSYSLKVRAVNIAADMEYDHEIEPMSRNLTLDGGQIKKKFCIPDQEENDEIYDKFWFSDNTKFYFASPWTYSPRVYKCTSTPIFAYIVAIIMLGFLLGLISYWLRSKYREMKDIEVILPEALVDQVSKYKFGNNSLSQSNATDVSAACKKEIHTQISRNNDCLVNFNQKENHQLLSNMFNGSTNVLTSLSSDNSGEKEEIENNEELTDEQQSYETTNEELSSNSSSIPRTDCSYDERSILQNTVENTNKNFGIQVSGQDATDDEIEDFNQTVTTDLEIPRILPMSTGGYVTPNTLLLASNLNTTERPTVISMQTSNALPNMKNGYIQTSAVKQLMLNINIVHVFVA
uniref:Cytokine receptor n=1 Tax=Glossina brevipalpis TaxID=37001 RepID=A0A1A9WHQ8_9MUSC